MFAIWFSQALGQVGAGTGLSGRVLDPSGNSVPEAVVTVTNVENAEKRSTTAAADGSWAIRSLTAGQHRIEVERDGFKKLVRSGITVTSLEMQTVELVLEIGELRQTVEVTADAEMTDSDSATVVRTLDNRELEYLPTAARNFTQLLIIQPGVTADLTEPLTNNNNNISPSVNGARTTSNSFVFNGIDVTNLLCCSSRITGDRGTIEEGGGSLSRNIAPAPETLAEVKLQTSLYDAATGRNGGGNFVLVSKSGTNDYHGSAYYFMQNEKLIANDFFFNKFELDRQRLRRHEGGFTFGGPLVIPGAYNGKNRTFFFGSYQRTEADTTYVDSASTTTRIPAALTDDRSVAGITSFAQSIWDPENFGLFNPAAFNDTSIALLQATYPDGRYLIPSGANGRNCEEEDLGVTCQVLDTQPATYRQDQFSVNLDHEISSANRLSGKFFYTDQPSLNPFSDSDAATLFQTSEDTKQRTFSITDTHVLGPAVINEFRFGYFFNRNDRIAVPFFTNAEFGINNPIANERPDLALIEIAGGDDIGDDILVGTPADDTDDKQQTFTVGNTVSVIKGKHSLKVGGEFRRHLLRGDLREVKNGEIGAKGWLNFLTVGYANPAEDGDAEQLDMSINYGETLRHYRMSDWSLFFTDDWRVTPNLTLNFGVRWEMFGMPWERDGLHATFDYDAALAALDSGSDTPLQDGFVFASNFDQQNFPGAAALPLRIADSKSILENDYNNIMPRFGFSWSPSGNRKVAVRGGYGIFYDRMTGAFVNSLRQGPPFFREAEFDDVGSYNAWPPDFNTLPIPNFVVGFDDGEPQLEAADNPGEEFEAFETQVIDPNLSTPYLQQWNLTLQWEFAPNWLAEVGYVGSKGTKLIQIYNQNQALDVAAVGGFLPRLGDVPNGGFIGNYFDSPDDQFVNLTQPPCDVTDDPEDCVIPAELRGRMLGFDEDEGVNTMFADSNSIYNSLQLSLEKRYSSGFMFNLNYTFSRSIDYFSDEGIFQAQHDQSRPFLNRGLSDFHRKHRFIFSWSWDLPFRGNKFVEGWMLSGIGTLQSGRPLTIVDDELSGFLFASRAPRPNIARGATHEDQKFTGGSTSSRVDNYLDRNAFASSGAQFGNLGRNTVVGPDQTRLDVSLSKITNLTERFNLEFRAEGYNITNTPNFRNPVRDMDDSSFGEIQQMRGGPRVFQLGLKLRF